MQRLKHIRGMSMWGWLVVMLLLLAGITMVMRLSPHYIDFYAVQNIVDGLTDEELKNASKRDLRELLQKRFKVNSLHDLEVEDVVAIKRGREASTIEVDYEVREPLLGNADVVLTFNKVRSF